MPAQVSPKNYLRLKHEATHKHEYYAGEIRAMADARAAHNQIRFNLNTLIGAQLTGGLCAGYTSDQRM